MDTYQKRFWQALALLTALRLFFIGQFELSPDEAYYWTWSRHLDWSYYDQGPMLAFVIRFFTSLTHSATAWSVRLGSVALSVFSAWMFFVLVRRIFQSRRAAWYAFLGMQAALLFSAGAVLMMHDSIMLCAWMGALLAFYRALAEDWQPGWIWGALALGLGALSKYTMALFVPCLLLFLLLSPRHRCWWRKPQLYLAGLGTLLLILPIIGWNAGHGWASFEHVANLGGAHKSFTLSWKYLFEFLGGQLAVMTPLLGAFCLSAPVLAWVQWRKNQAFSEAYLFLACFCFPILFFFLLLSLNTSIYANWPAPAYPAALAILAGWLETLRQGKAARPAIAWARATLVLGAALTLLVHLEVGWSIFPLSGHAADSVNRIRGWQELGVETGQRLEQLTLTGSKPFLAARRYQIAALLSFYTPGQPEVELFPSEPQAQNQYRFWTVPGLYPGQNALFVCEDGWEADPIRPFFSRVEALPEWVASHSGRPVREIRFFQGIDYHPDGRARIGIAGTDATETAL